MRHRPRLRRYDENKALASGRANLQKTSDEIKARHYESRREYSIKRRRNDALRGSRAEPHTRAATRARVQRGDRTIRRRRAQRAHRYALPRAPEKKTQLDEPMPAGETPPRPTPEDALHAR